MDSGLKKRQIRRKVDPKSLVKVKNWKVGWWRRKRREIWRSGDQLDIGKQTPA